MSELNIVQVDTKEAMTDCVEAVSAFDTIAFDLEFDRNRYRYGFNLCLMQVMAGEVCYLIDPLPDEVDMSGIFAILESREVLKVVFSAKEDLELLHHMGCHPVNIYDVGMAIRLIDFPQSSLAVVFEHYLGLVISKDSQTSNWFTRPLSDAQRQYAALDVYHLITLMDRVKAKVEEMGRTAWVAEENALFEERDFGSVDEQLLYSEKDKKDLNEVDFHIFCRMLQYREELAAETDVPPGRLLHKDYLKEILLSNGMRYWERNRRLHKSIRNAEHKELMIANLKRWEAEALDSGLSPERKSKKKLSREEYAAFKQARIEKEEFMENFIKPLKAALEEMYGEHTASFLLSNRVAGDMKSDESIGLPSYRLPLIRAAAEKAQLPLEEIAVFKAENSA